MNTEITPDKFIQQIQLSQDFTHIKRKKYKNREPAINEQGCGKCLNCWGKPINGELKFGIGICHHNKSNYYHKQVKASDFCKYYEGDVD